jgi:hypothetical protein
MAIIRIPYSTPPGLCSHAHRNGQSAPQPARRPLLNSAARPTKFDAQTTVVCLLGVASYLQQKIASSQDARETDELRRSTALSGRKGMCLMVGSIVICTREQKVIQTEVSHG